MNSKEFHDFHRNQTFSKQHWKKDGTDEFVGYKYVQKSNQDKCVTVFIPTHINPDDYKLIGKTIENVLNIEFGSYF
jgi:hypothetical protein